MSAVSFVALAAGPVCAQPAKGPIVSGSLATAVTNGHGNVSVAGSAGYRVNRALGFAVELTWIPSIDPPDSGIVPLAIGALGGADSDVLLFTTNVRLEVPTISRRVLPFVMVGGGVASVLVSHRFGFVDPVFILGGPSATGAEPPAVPGSTLYPYPYPYPYPYYTYQETMTGLALVLGGGASFVAGDHLSIDIDLREIHLRSYGGGDIGRFGVGASYRF